MAGGFILYTYVYAYEWFRMALRCEFVALRCKFVAATPLRVNGQNVHRYPVDPFPMCVEEEEEALSTWLTTSRRKIHGSEREAQRGIDFPLGGGATLRGGGSGVQGVGSGGGGRGLGVSGVEERIFRIRFCPYP